VVINSCWFICTGHSSGCSDGSGNGNKLYWTAGRGNGSDFVWNVQYSNDTVIELPMIYDDPWLDNRPEDVGEQSCLDLFRDNNDNYGWDHQGCAVKYCALCEIDP